MTATETREFMNVLGASHEAFVFLFDFEMDHPLVFRYQEAADHGVLFDFNGTANYSPDPPAWTPFRFEPRPIDYQTYLDAFQVVSGNLEEGNSYLVNLTFPTPVDTDLSFRRILSESRSKYRLLLRDDCVIFSPETFVTIRNGIITSNPMKGTIDASLEDAEQMILEDVKEIAEHNTIVDLIRNDLSLVASAVRVKRFRYVERITTNFKDLLQVSSEITGVLPPDYPGRIGDILFTLLPAGSVSGAPKQRTLEIIREAERIPRGFYTGVAGYFDGYNLDSMVMIRYLERTSQGVQFRSGGGITVFSDPAKEYQEMIDKVYVPVV